MRLCVTWRYNTVEGFRVQDSNLKHKPVADQASPVLDCVDPATVIMRPKYDAVLHYGGILRDQAR